MLIRNESKVLLSQWRQIVKQLPSAKHLDVPTLNDHIADLLTELADAFESCADDPISEAHCNETPQKHGVQRFQDGFEIDEVVAEYNILRGCIHDLASANNLSIQGKAFHIMNRVLDEAISMAVQTYATQQALQMQQRRSEYLTFVTHDLRTPLNAISLATHALEIALSPKDKTPQMATMLKVLERNVVNLSKLVSKVLEENNNLQTETGIQLHRREFDLWPLVEALIHDLHPVAGTDSTQLINNIPEDLVVFADASLLRRVFQNLIANAIKYTPRGKIEIVAKTIAPDGVVECQVIDNGAGISEELRSKVFEKYETDGDGGLGLGLAIVKTFVEAHEGTLVVDSAEGKGSTFCFTLSGKHL
ncbi:MAG: HAMP domain-containing sensor histidine kinase [Pseudomonadota bacterium]